MRPSYKITANDVDITDLIRKYFISLKLSDSTGLESDSLTITISDNETISWPTKGAALKCWIGYDDQLYYKGRFVVSDLDHAGPPDMITIHALASDMLGSIKEIKTKQWSDTSVADIIRHFASIHGLRAAVSSRFDNIKITQLYQVNESDLHFTTRLAMMFGATTSIKSGYIVFISQGSAANASGVTLPTQVIHRKDTSSHSYQERGRNEYRRTSAAYIITEPTLIDGVLTNIRRYYFVYAGELTGTTYHVEGYSSSKEMAQQAAESALRGLDRASSTLSLELQQGKPELVSEMPIEPTGFRKRIVELPWVSDNVTHTINSSGLTSSLSASVSTDL
jgi:phage protein D